MRRVCSFAGKVGRRKREGDGFALSRVGVGRLMVGRPGGGERDGRRQEGVQVREAGFWGFNSRKSMFGLFGCEFIMPRR